jgi:hypothetical protein
MRRAAVCVGVLCACALVVGVIARAWAPPPGPYIEAAFTATVGGGETWDSTSGSGGQSPPYLVAKGQQIDFEDKSGVVIPIVDGAGEPLPGLITKREWRKDSGAWTELPSGVTTWSYTPDSTGVFVIQERLSADGCTPAICSMKFDAHDVASVTVTPDEICLVPGDQYEFTGHAWDAEENELPATFDWTPQDKMDPDDDSTKSTFTAPQQTGNYTVTATHDASNESGTAIVHVVAVSSVAWEAIDSPLDTCPKNGGKRIFPDKQTPDDQTDRSTVRVTATIAPAAPNQPVLFRIFDVDDPSASEGPIDDNDSGGPTGNDNRGGLGQFQPSGTVKTGYTDANGETSVDLTVPTRPGDNIVVLASCDPFELVEVTQQDVDEDDLPDGIVSSEMLTVWRRLSVEFDCMGEPPAGEQFGTVTGTSARITTALLQAQGSPGWAMQCLVGGVLDPDDSDGQAPNSVDFTGQVAVWEVATSGTTAMTVLHDYTGDLFDNDEQNGADDAGEDFDMSAFAADPSNTPFAVNTDDPKWLTDLEPPGEGPVIAGMNGYFNDAYIQVVALTEGNDHPTCGFVRRTNLQQAHVDVPGDSMFWCVCVTWAYETAYGKQKKCQHNGHTFYWGDDDPEDEGVPSGYSRTIYGIAETIPGEACMIYCESVRDGGFPYTTACLVSHEVGHLLGLNHALYSDATGFQPDWDGIMGWTHLDEDSDDFCYKTWMDTVWAHQMPDRFSWGHIAYMRTIATD